LKGVSRTSDLQLLLGFRFTLCLQLSVLAINLILELLATLLHVYLEGSDLSSMGLVTAFAFVLEKLADLGELVGVTCIDRLDLVKVGLLALCV